MREHGRGGSGTTLAGPHRVGTIPTGSARLGFAQKLSSFLTGTNARACIREKKSLGPYFHRFVVLAGHKEMGLKSSSHLRPIE